MLKPSILIVDDEAGVRSALSGVLRDEGYGVEAVESGEACLDRRPRNPSLIRVIRGFNSRIPLFRSESPYVGCYDARAFSLKEMARERIDRERCRRTRSFPHAPVCWPG